MSETPPARDIGNIHAGRDVILGDQVTFGYSVEQVQALLTQIRTEFQPKPFDGTCPYVGLRAFGEQDAERFFGRERLVEELLERVKDSRAIFITGPSGSGKSSLARAGLIPALKAGQVRGSERWLYTALTPGRDPLEALATAVSRLKSPETGDYLRQRAARDSEALHKVSESLLGDEPDQRLVLLVDQFEEIFAPGVKEEERQAFLTLLTRAAMHQNGRTLVLFTMRSDFVANCATYRALNKLLNQQFFQVGAMQPDELVRAVALPVEQVGLPIEPQLVAQVIADMGGEPGALPLMQFALTDLFEWSRERGTLTALTQRDYLVRGGLHKSLERHAQTAFAALSAAEQELAKTLFRSLVEVRGEGAQDTRRTARLEELIPAQTDAAFMEGLVRKLADARLLITAEDEHGARTVTLAHEKLIQAWPWLKTLIEEDRARIALQNQVARDAAEWLEHDRDPSYLYTGTRLAAAREKLSDDTLSAQALAFLKAGALAAEQARRQRERTRQRITAGLVVGSAILLVITTLALFQWRRAEQQANLAIARQLAAQAQTAIEFEGGYADVANLTTQSGLLAVEAGQRGAGWGADQALRRYLALAALPVASLTHEDNVNSVDFSPDGRYVVSGSGDGTARVWQAQTGAEVTRMMHEGGVTSVAFSPDGRYVVSGSSDGTARMWEAQTGAEVARTTHESGVTSVAFSPDGRYVLSGGDDGTAQVWEAQTGVEVARITHESLVNSVAFSPDGRYVVSGSSDGTARVWEAQTGAEVARMTHESDVTSVAFSPDGRYVVSGSWDGTVRVWQAQTGAEMARITHDGDVWAVAFSPDGRYVVSGCDDYTSRVWEAQTGAEVTRMTHEGPVVSVAFSPDGRYVVSGSGDGTARVWWAQTGAEVARMTHESGLTSVAFSPDGRYVLSGGATTTARVWNFQPGAEVLQIIPSEGSELYFAISPNGRYLAAGSWDEPVRVWDLQTGVEVVRMAHESGVNSIAFSPDGQYVVFGNTDNTIDVWETQTGAKVARMTHEEPVVIVDFSPDGRHVVSGSEDGTARVWEAQTGVEVARMAHKGQVRSADFSPDGRYVLSGSYDGTVRVWEAQTGVEVARMKHDNFVLSVAFSPDGRYVLSGSLDGLARVWEAQTGAEVAHMRHKGGVLSSTFSPDGRYVVSGSGDGTAQVWEAQTGTEVARITHEGAVQSVAFSPDGRYVLSGSEDGTARVWEAQTGAEVARMTHDNLVLFVAFSPDGRYVISSGLDDGISVWYWRIADLMAEACRRLPRNLTLAEWQTYIGDEPYRPTCPDKPIPDEDEIEKQHAILVQKTAFGAGAAALFVLAIGLVWKGWKQEGHRRTRWWVGAFTPGAAALLSAWFLWNPWQAPTPIYLDAIGLLLLLTGSAMLVWPSVRSAAGRNWVLALLVLGASTYALAGYVFVFLPGANESMALPGTEWLLKVWNWLIPVWTIRNLPIEWSTFAQVWAAWLLMAVWLLAMGWSIATVLAWRRKANR
ncbi:MAG: hypothetical protein DDG60_02865 [Anaerolineae bacterium]|nr:MAG: hypothetical protein DDG60_02865 [Anaerolineae bacterium]